MPWSSKAVALGRHLRADDSPWLPMYPASYAVLIQGCNPKQELPKQDLCVLSCAAAAAAVCC